MNRSTFGHDAELIRAEDRPGLVAWYDPSVKGGWTYIPIAFALMRLAAAREARTARARVLTRQRLETGKAPTRWPAKHRPLLDFLRANAQVDLEWSWNDSKKKVGELDAGALLVQWHNGTERIYSSLDEAAADLVPDMGTSKPKRTGKAELLNFVRTVVVHLPEDHRAEAERLLEAA